MENQLFFDDIYNGADTITYNNTPTTVTYTSPLPASIDIPNISNVFDLFKLDADVSNLVLGVLAVFVMVVKLQSYFKIIILILITIFMMPDLALGFIYAFAVFSAGELAARNWLYMILLAIILIHVIVRNNFITNINPSSINIDLLFLIIEGVVLLACIFVPMINKLNSDYALPSELLTMMSTFQ